MAAFAERGEISVGVRGRVDREGEGDALELALAGAIAVGGHQHLITDLEGAMHDLIVAAGRVVLRLRILLEPHEHDHFGAEGFLIEIQRLFGAAVEHQIGIHVHGFGPLLWWGEG